MTKIKMNFQDYSVCKPDLDWFESSCNMWVEHYSFLLGLSFNTEVDNVWFREQISFNKLYDV